MDDQHRGSAVGRSFTASALGEWRPHLPSTVPPYEQLRQFIAAGVASGEFPVGAKLPSVRALAESAGMAPNTVARSIRELEQAGVLETAGRKGTFVSANGDVNRTEMAHAAAQFAEMARDLGIAEDEALSIAAAALKAVAPASARVPGKRG